MPLSKDWPSFLKAARACGLSTAALLNWQQINAIVEPDAATTRVFLDGGYSFDDDKQLAALGTGVLALEPDVAFAYLVSPDVAGHDHGWGSAEYYEALRCSDAALGELIDAAGDDCAILVTTDHGGHGNDHTTSAAIDMVTFVVLRAASVSGLTMWPTASILDIAPTVAALAGFAAPPVWSGMSLLGTERLIVEDLFEQIASMAGYSYGEHVNMLEHSLQAAAAARATGAPNELIAASLLHDVGHLRGDVGEWGLPGHAGVGAQVLQQLLPAGVVEPIRLHVDAKRYLVATDPTYESELSLASQESLREQGGPFSPPEIVSFEQEPFATEAISLRRFDDGGKTLGADVPALETYRPLIAELLAGSIESPRWKRDACACAQCRDPQSGQHLLDIGDLSDPPDRTHVFERPVPDPEPLLATMWQASDQRQLLSPASGHDIASRLSEFGLALVRDVEPVAGTVLRFAATLGFVRSTNYGDLFEVRSVPDPNNLAYTSLGLPLHTDNPYRDPVPTVQLLHCLQPAAVGGASVFCDGFSVAEQFRLQDPTAFQTLVTTPLDFRFRDAHVDLQARHTMIDVAVDGSVQAIHLNHRSMVTPPPGPRTEAFYDAYQAFAALLNDASNVVEFTMQSGDLLAFNNRRILHSRTSFSTLSTRHLQGCYIDIDAVHSQARQLASH